MSSSKPVLVIAARLNWAILDGNIDAEWLLGALTMTDLLAIGGFSHNLRPKSQEQKRLENAISV